MNGYETYVVMLNTSMPGYEAHRYDILRRAVKVNDVEFAIQVHKHTGLHIDLNFILRRRKNDGGIMSSEYFIVNENGERTNQMLMLEFPRCRYMTGVLDIEPDVFEPNNYVLVKRRKKPKVDK